MSNESKVRELLALSKSYYLYLRNTMKELTRYQYIGYVDVILKMSPDAVKEDPIFKLTLQKYQSLHKLCQILESGEDAAQKLAAFKQTFMADKNILSQRRDSTGTTFLKGIATILTLGVVCLFGIWSTKGGEFSKEVRLSLSPNV